MEYDAGKLSVHIELIKLGVRSAARMTLRREDLPDASRAIQNARLHAFCRSAGASHTDLFIFAHTHLVRVLEQILESPQPMQDWALGKLFGYSEDAIGKFIAKGFES